MIVYLDTSVILSKLLNQENKLNSWGNWDKAWTSFLCRMEFFRTIDRLRLESIIGDEEREKLYQDFEKIWAALYRYPITEDVQKRTGESFPTALGTLDAVHLSTAIKISEIEVDQVHLLTHDKQLSRGAGILGFEVIGL